VPLAARSVTLNARVSHACNLRIVKGASVSLVDSEAFEMDDEEASLPSFGARSHWHGEQ
jgi:hypothetical protein